ncbi:MAG: hypothetical protein BGO55_28055 [Sphingobacteriales bacterium 50-39]|nr:hypothetical protein [Sphingobacteriales bacterium]OJW56890.1 MAG: hypothetical protein BGO55_28055 [Sphingobacteriales bacterium 50-39]
MHSNRIIICLLILATAFNSCVKQKFDTPALSEFASRPTSNKGAYFITSDPGTEFKIPIGITTTANKDRVINFTVTSPSGAVAGTQYTIGASSITIPAGKVMDSITVKGIYSAYAPGKIDTLIFTISGGDVPAYSGSDKYTLTLQKYCDVVSTDLIGDYTNSGDFIAGSGGSPQNPYTVTISDWTSTGPTTASIKIHNLGATSDYGFGDTSSTVAGFLPADPAAMGLSATLDWTNPSSFTVTIPKQTYVLNSYGNGPSTISGSGKFSSCSETFSITFKVADASTGSGTYTAVTTRLIR